jgi:uncharacterized Ntn-hydrolase superfamily protein
MARPASVLAVLLLGAIMLASGRAAATYSIVALDRRTGAFGQAVASCVPLATLDRVPGVVPGKGAVMTQSYLFPDAHAKALALLGKSAPAPDVLAAMIDPAFDPDFSLRQYAVIDARAGARSFTGAGALDWAGSLERTTDRFVVLVQGNVLTGEEVLRGELEGFFADGACDLADRLFRALRQGGAPGAGDARCAPAGFPAASAELQVQPSDLLVGAFLHIAFDNPVNSPDEPPLEDPIAALEHELEAWRADHPCSGPADTSTDAGSPAAKPTVPAADPSGCMARPGSVDPWWYALPLAWALALRPRARARHLLDRPK